jgi:molecular chaperone HscB
MSAPIQASAQLPPEILRQLDVAQPDYFAFFGLHEHLAVDAIALQKAFYERSRLLHPDRFARASAQDRADSLRASSILNDAYRTLRDPLPRAEYVLTRHGFDIGDQRSSNVPPELLEEVFELNLALDELRSGDDEARPQLQEAQARFLAMRDECDSGLQRLFSVWDSQHSRDTLAEIRAILNRRRYIQNLVRDVEAVLSA